MRNPLRFELVEHEYKGPALMSIVAAVPGGGSEPSPGAFPEPYLPLHLLHAEVQGLPGRRLPVPAITRAEPSLTLKSLAMAESSSAQRQLVGGMEAVERESERETGEGSQRGRSGRGRVVVGERRRLGIKIKHAGLKRLLSGAFSGAVSRTAVAPLETIRTHLMVGSAGKTLPEVFGHIMETEGWKGLFRGNGVNVLRVAPSKAIELFAYDTVKKILTDKSTSMPRFPLPVASIAGATAGVCSTLVTYPLELLKTRLTIQRGVYDNLLHAFVRIVEEEGPRELYRGLSSSLIGVIPYSATNYFAYDTLRKCYRKMTKEEHIGNIATLIMGSTAGAISSAATFPLEVARKQMQVGAVSGRVVYRNVFHALSSIVEKEGLRGLYRGLGASCIKLMPAAGISFMCYEACKRILINEES